MDVLKNYLTKENSREIINQGGRVLRFYVEVGRVIVNVIT